MDTLVLVSRTRWDEAPRLRHQIAEFLSPFFRIVFVEIPGAWVRHGLVRRGHRELREGFVIVSLGNAALPPERVLSASPALRRLLRRRWQVQIERAVARHAPGRSLLMNFTPDLPGLMDSPVFAAAIYVCNDDWVALAPGGLKHETALLETQTAGRADLCLAVSHPLKERLERFNPRTELLLPGHPFGGEQPRWRRPEPPYVLCFMGYLNDRVEQEWLAAALRDPGWELRLIGTRESSFGDARLLTATGRCRFLGELRGHALFEALSAAHVLALPYRLTPAVVAATAPNKLFSYLATGRPIVASALPRLLELPPHTVAQATTAEAFAAACRQAVAEDSEERFSGRVHLAAEHAWERRALWLRGLLENLTHSERVSESSRSPECSRPGA
jgi:glycosyltransferase involved in cell wall biosynthesis